MIQISPVDPDRQSRIRSLNDELRVQATGGRILITSGIQALGEEAVRTILEAVRDFDQFTPDNDPYGEHDFGSLEVEAHHIFFKIDSYEPTGSAGSEDPADSEKTLRVLTIMHAEEY